jgi:hypothetical protein
MNIVVPPFSDSSFTEAFARSIEIGAVESETEDHPDMSLLGNLTIPLRVTLLRREYPVECKVDL